VIYIHPVRDILNGIRRLTTLQKSTIATLAIAFTGLYLSSWKPLKIQGIGGGHDYADLASVLNAASCFREIGADVYTGTDQCGYQYGLFLLKLINLLHLNSLTPFFLGGLLFILVACLLLVTGALSSATRKHAAIACLILLSPGPWLLFERGNFDLLIILFLTVTVLTLNTRLSFIGAALLLATVLMKFYTFPLVLLYLLLEKNKWNKLAIGVSSLAIIDGERHGICARISESDVRGFWTPNSGSLGQFFRMEIQCRSCAWDVSTICDWHCCFPIGSSLLPSK
jgi:hypothetical protein